MTTFLNEGRGALATTMTPRTRPVSWIKAALKHMAKPVRGMGSGVFEIALPFRGDAFRVVYAVQLNDAIWVIHAFQKKSTQGIKTPARDVDVIKERLKRLREMLE
jgi:phage-related protein